MNKHKNMRISHLKGEDMWYRYIHHKNEARRNISSAKVYWFDYYLFGLNELPNSDWLCFATSDVNPDMQKFDRFVRHCIGNGIAEFKGHGKYGEKLHDLFDDTMVQMEVFEKHEPISVMTTSHDDETYAETFWQCFFATCLPETTDYDNISIVCTDLTGKNRVNELKKNLELFDNGWLPK